MTGFCLIFEFAQPYPVGNDIRSADFVERARRILFFVLLGAERGTELQKWYL